MENVNGGRCTDSVKAELEFVGRNGDRPHVGGTCRRGDKHARGLGDRQTVQNRGVHLEHSVSGCGRVKGNAASYRNGGAHLVVKTRTCGDGRHVRDGRQGRRERDRRRAVRVQVVKKAIPLTPNLVSSS